MKIALTGGGTLGHVFPTLAVAEQIAKTEKNVTFLYIGSKRSIDKESVTRAGIPYFAISSGKLRRYFSLSTVTDGFRIIAGFFSSRAVLKRERPDVLFSKGGYVSVPVVLAAASLGIRVVTHESDRSLGLANRINARFCDKVCLSFHADMEGDTYVYTGPPIRSDLFKETPIPFSSPYILVLGGSQGAVEVNNAIYENLEALTALAAVYHQAGEKGDFSVKAPKYIQVPFISEELGSLIAHASVVITRAGAGALSECSALSAPMILMPLGLNASRGDQILNAEYYESLGAAVVLKEKKDLVALVSRILKDEELRASMKSACQKLDNRNSAERIAAIVLEKGEK